MLIVQGVPHLGAQSVDAGVHQRSAWCPIWELTSSTD